ncbi:D-alanyl-D-alanine carboxypeptidase/D-alanyl-D-alanine-endopeptidase [Epidermidibacterium keratini]|uniref:D-alanyl-D-alanine carboxypeptidase/D-alanyl-D-alanine-endopeptidase n=1 Tax=Epidermidibacterium keratini TaxID=1891644 RepID=A0A7L4YQ07_9ACTN|nr:D-alanyl-D-alanine carboxypeptidase/D-alanyl-D-alanine-endopeptidase [Epidermidibacterium keratini]QHC00993.1 D-alanyl-D-alanine carboxypeptidase/D-alanyl-D-alanine-endopeptidase [Epidermidibacterium keratini]
MKKPDLSAFGRRSPAVRVLIGALVLVVAAAVGLGVVVATASIIGPTHSDSADGDGANQASPTVSLPANGAPPPALPALNPNAPVPDPAALQTAAAAALSNPALGALTAKIVDPESGSVLFDQGSTTPMQPGSTVKLYTAAAAALLFEPGSRLTTTVSTGASPTEIVIVAGGDITLSSQPESALYPGAATLQALADAVKAAGITQVTKVTVDGSLFEGATTAQGWGSGDAPSTYAAPVYPFMVDGGRTSADFKAMRYAEPDLAAAQQLAALLGNPQAEVARGAVDPNASVLASVQSAPIEDLIERMILDSDNTLAEVIARLVAVQVGQPRTFEGAVAAVSQVMTEAGVDMSGYAAYDASGISQLNVTTSSSLASLLSLATSGDAPKLDVVSSALAVSGYNGTLATRYEAGDAAAGAAGAVRGKTGTLSAVNSLAGTIVTADGRLLVFAFISNGGADLEATRAALDDVAAAVASCGC